MSNHHSAAGRLTSVLVVGVLTLALAGCGDQADDGGGNASATSTASDGQVFNAADVAFATAMIPHHAQAIEMVTLTDGRTLDPAVAQLAAEIRDAQVPEVETMTDWLTEWGEEVPETSLDHTNAGHEMGDDMAEMSDMPGMMSADEMSALGQASDAEFEDQWLQLMVEHHEGAIEMARTEVADGANVGAVALATSIIATQQAEIDAIDALLAD